MDEDREDDDMSLAFVEGQADVWAEQINLNAMIENVTSPMRLNPNVPKEVRESFAKRMREQMDALLRQAFMEGAFRAMTGFAVDEPSRPVRDA